jgi:hypothetical protein
VIDSVNPLSSRDVILDHFTYFGNKMSVLQLYFKKIALRGARCKCREIGDTGREFDLFGRS